MNRVAAYGTCGRCDDRHKLSVHPKDTGGTIRIRCPACLHVTEHAVGGVRFA